MAKGSHRRPGKGKKKSVKNLSEIKGLRNVKDREKQNRKSKDLVRQMRGKKWDEDEYSEEFESELEDI